MRISILGATGSIGTQTLRVVAMHPDRIRVAALAAGGRVQVTNAAPYSGTVFKFR